MGCLWIVRLQIEEENLFIEHVSPCFRLYPSKHMSSAHSSELDSQRYCIPKLEKMRNMSQSLNMC